MSNFGGLVLNENMKIYRRMRTWVIFGILLAIMLTATAIMHSMDRSHLNENKWRENVQQEVNSLRATLEQPEHIPQFALKQIEETLKMQQYRLDHDLNPSVKTLWDWVQSLSNIGFVLIIFTIVIAADMVAAEFTWGTIKMLLIRPASRSTILFSKYIATLLFSLILLLILFVGSLAIGGVLEGLSGIGQPDLYIGADGEVHERIMLVKVFQTYGFMMVELLMYVTLAFMISSAFRSSSMAIAFSLGLLLLGNTIIQLLSQYSWAKYILFANTNLQQYTDGRVFQEGMTLTFSIGVLLGYFILFHLISLILFTKRDVAT